MSLVIAIDGPAGSGKSSLAKMLADQFKLNQVDSGALYRTYTWLSLQFCRQHNQALAHVIHQKDFNSFLEDQQIDIFFDENNHQQITVDGISTEKFIRTPEITNNIKLIADEPFIRELVKKRLQALAQKSALVADGRDMGTEVFPGADIKFFVTASLPERARRRFDEFKQKYPQITLGEVENQISQRDNEDQNRPLGALKQAGDAILIDTTSQSLDDAFITIKTQLSASKSPEIQDLLKR